MRWLAREAARAGAHVRFGHPYRDGDGSGKARYLVGADGPRSRVARDCRPRINREFLIGVEGEYEGVRGLDDDRLHCFLDGNLARGYIGWIVPGYNGIAQIGLACRYPRTPDLRAFLRKIASVADSDACAMPRVIGVGSFPSADRIADGGRQRAPDRRCGRPRFAALRGRHSHRARIGMGGRPRDRGSRARGWRSAGRSTCAHRAALRRKARDCARSSIAACPTPPSMRCCRRAPSRRSRARCISTIAGLRRRRDGGISRRRCCADSRNAPRRAAEHQRKIVPARHVVVPQELQVPVGERRPVREVAYVACDARDRRGHPHNGHPAAAQRGEVAGQRAPVAPSQLRFAMVAARKLAQARDRDARVVDMQDGDAPGSVRWDAMHRQLRHRVKPARAETAFALEQRRPHDRAVGAARANRLFGRGAWK
jgi:hypothetical protein